MKPHVWINRDNSELIIAFPWIAASEEVDWGHFEPLRLALTTVHQVGWLLCNKNNVYFGVPMDVIEQFEDLGAL